ncbi:MAG: tetratricopeptide repeat protein [Cryomorphaceae bacterium]|nr:tetratricopeptide repeat protein [Flavobacteriales bacterium]
MRNLLFLCAFCQPFVCFSQNSLIAEAQTLYDIEKYPQAQHILKDVVGSEEATAEAFHLMANCLQKEEKFVAAIQFYEKAEKLNDASAALMADHAAALLNLKQYKEAEKKLKKALKADPDLPEAHYFYGNVKYFDFNSSAALKHYNKAIELRPDYRDALYMRAAAYAEKEKNHLAVRDYEAVLNIDPNLETAKFNIAVIRLQNDEYEKAAEDLADLDPAQLPRPADYYFSLGESLYFSGKQEEACEAYQKSMDHGDAESKQIYTRYCLNKEERDEMLRTRTIRMAF